MLGIPLVHETLLLVNQLLLKLLLSDLLQLDFPSDLAFQPSLLFLFVLVASLDLLSMLSQQSLILSLLSHNSLHGFLIVGLGLCGDSLGGLSKLG